MNIFNNSNTKEKMSSQQSTTTENYFSSDLLLSDESQQHNINLKSQNALFSSDQRSTLGSDTLITTSDYAEIEGIKYQHSRDIFSWTSVQSDFETFSTFLALLKVSNSFLHDCSKVTEYQPFRTCSKCHLQFKRILWDLFAGFSSWGPALTGGCRLVSIRSEEEDKHLALEYYQSKLGKHGKKKYADLLFLERFKVLTRISKACPIRLDLLTALHDFLIINDCKVKEENTLQPGIELNLFATITIDRLGVPYCRFRTQKVQQDSQTSRLTREYRNEELFLRVNFFHSHFHMDARRRFVTPEKEVDFQKTVAAGSHGLVHTLSILMNIACDSVENTGKHIDIINVLGKEKSKVERLNSPQSIHSTRWSSTNFDSIEEQWLLSKELAATYDDLFKKGMEIAGLYFKYLMTTSGGVHNNMHIFHGMNSDRSADFKDYRGSCSTIHKDLCMKMFSKDDFEKLQDQPLKMSLRMGLWSTPSISMKLFRVNIKLAGDIGEHTDGCGRISCALAEEMSKIWYLYKDFKNMAFSPQNVGPTKWNANTEHDAEIEFIKTDLWPKFYSAFQVRLDGIKGMFVVDPRLKDRTLIASRSQLKFIPREITALHDTIEILQCSQPMRPARLNFSLISLIIGCAQDPIGIQNYIIEAARAEITRLLSNRSSAIKFAIEHNDVKSFNMLGAGCSLEQTFLAGYYQNFGRRFKIQIKDSRRLYGVADFWDVLDENQVYVSVSGVPRIEGNVLVTKEPCYHRGDLRKLTAVSRNCLHHLKDVIVFSCKGLRSESSKICGSDLDGDQYFVCWDKKIVDNIVCFQPGDFGGNLLPNKQERVGYPRSRATLPVFASNINFLHQRRKSPIHKRRNKELGLSDDESTKVNETIAEKQRELPKRKINENSSPEDFEELLQKAAEKAVKPHGVNTENVSIHELFDMRMRIIDSLGSEWTSWEWEPLMNKFCCGISDALDSAKTGRSVESIEWAFLWQNASVPKYPNFHPSKRKEDCQVSHSALGYMYKNISEYIQNPDRQTLTPQTENIVSHKMLKKTLFREIWTNEWEILLTFPLPKGVLDEVILCINKLKPENGFTQVIKKKYVLEKNPAAPNLATIQYKSLEGQAVYDIYVHCETDPTKLIFSDRIEISKHHQISVNAEPCPDTLYDAICQLKFDFLLYYTNVKCHGGSSFISSHETPKGTEDEPSTPPVFSLQNIERWYNSVDEAGYSSLVAKEAVCTMLWKFITWRALKQKLASDLTVVYIQQGSSLSSIPSKDLEQAISKERFLCLDESLLDELELTGEETLPVLDSKAAQVIIGRLGDFVEKNFWKYLGLPYPGYVRRTQPRFGYDLYCSSTFKQLASIFERQTSQCLEPVYYNSEENMLQIQDMFFRNMLPALVNTCGSLWCSPVLWNSWSNVAYFAERLAKVTLYHIQMYKHLEIVKFIGQKAEDDENNEKISYEKRWNSFPRDPNDENLICLRSVGMTDAEIEHLLSILYH